ncbi:glycoside hydrolase family 2 TIM barrel-domain containing protein [Enterococcus nangangensis]|uniref:glycoside hydrolase family 2 TIM barrel-domain containing protein n=1 Tax=Enterococcus nangangensis TaxID=2559926 RepID=UPI0010F65D4B|nr:glycoside hydrolase family 2 TIM barrel-domain containing protein [Enterococcus nangangensis]
MKKLFNEGWEFSEQPLGQPTFDFTTVKEAIWQSVRLPHDWLITDSENLYRDSEGWYRKAIYLDKTQKKAVNMIEFDGVYVNSQFFINQQLVGEWKNGYTNFTLDLTPYLTVGENEIFVRVIHQAPNSRWYSGAGIYRNVWWHTLPNVYCAPHEMYLHEVLLDDELNEWKLEVDLFLNKKSHRGEEITVKEEIFFKKKRLLVKENNFNFKAAEKQKKLQMVTLLTDVKRWSPDEPNLYEIQLTIIGKDFKQVLKEHVGFRDIQLTPDRGMLINGKAFKIQGVCQHHDLGALGSAFNRDAQKRQLHILKKMGVNAIRTAHNPAAEEYLNLADEMGFLIQSEFTDVWKHPKTTYDYAQYFTDWVAKDVASWVCRDRNHPSVFMWSIGNEIYDTQGREDGLATLEQLVALVKTYDYKENAVITFGSNYLLWEKTQKIADHLKIVGYNYGETLYAEHHQQYPDWIIYGSETGSVVQSRGVYHFPLAQSILADDDEQCSSLGNSTTSWGAKSIERCIIQDRNIPYSLGQFIWTGTDYIGEPTPYHTKNSYFGQIDTAGFPKDAYYVFQAAWVNYHEAPMIHLFPYWDFSEGQEIDLRVCSNAPEIELFFNGASLGRQKNDVYHGEKLIHDWQIPYAKGQLKAVAYDLDGKIVATDVVTSFGDVAQLQVLPNRQQLTANGTDIVFLEINGLDAEGTLVANGNNEIAITVSGAGELLGLDNGDSTDYRSYKGNQKRLFNGKLLAIVGTTIAAGDIVVTVASPHLPQKTIKIPVVADGRIEEACPAETAVIPVTPVMTVPIRKIELQHNLTKSIITGTATVTITAQTYPANADEQPLFWRLTDEKGIDSDLAEIEITGNQVTLRPKANGKVYVRCGCHNGKPALDLYAQLDFEIQGLQAAFLNPYEMISGGKYTRSNLPMTNGNERGVATLRGEESWVVFDDVDFGSTGSNEITLSLFPLETNPFAVEIWQGYPHDATSQQVAVVTYTLGSVWNTYQEQTFHLPQKLKGKTTLSFVFRQKVHMKGFWFTPVTHSFQKISAVENDYIYGDQFQLTSAAVEKIGNNVILGFRDFDFGTTAVTAIEVVGRAATTNNSIQLKVKDNETEDLYLLEFTAAPELQQKIFPLPAFTGKKNIEFVFLPGSNFDFSYFQFLTTPQGE